MPEYPKRRFFDYIQHLFSLSAFVFRVEAPPDIQMNSMKANPFRIRESRIASGRQCRLGKGKIDLPVQRESKLFSFRMASAASPP